MSYELADQYAEFKAPEVNGMSKSFVKAIETQAIGRAVRLGQKKPVTVVRFITKDTVEEEHFNLNRYDINILQN